MVNLTINGRAVQATEGMTVLEAAGAAGIEIPHLCFLKEINEIGACRVCVVEIEGHDRLSAACNTTVEEGMSVLTDSPKARRARRTNLQLILSQHKMNCPVCIRENSCQLKQLCADMNLLKLPYESNYRKMKWDMSAPIIRDEGKCIKCMRCVQFCDKVQSMNIWDISGTGSWTTIDVKGDCALKASGCTYCGQCVTHCPTGALTARDDTQEVYEALEDPDRIVLVQVAPAVRAAWAEGLQLDAELATPGRMAAALKAIGFDYVFDTNWAADLTIMEEGSEFIHRFTHYDEYKWPMFTSCCPGWVRFLKGQFPEFTDSLSTAKSPQQMFGAVAKSYFAEKLGLDPKKLFCVSLMPCTAKKSERALPTMKNDAGDWDVDAVITTREFERMLRSRGVALNLLGEIPFDSPLGESTGAAVIFGATGGVMDAALRSAYYMVTGENPDPDSFAAVRGLDGWKEAEFTIPGAGSVQVAVVSGLGNARKLMDAISEGSVHYDFVEVMACPGGCAGGGGQPISPDKELAGVRGDKLWGLDKVARLRYSHENSEVKALYDEYLGKPLSEKAHHLLHTDHHGWEAIEKK
ncbi:MAG: [FeFe] hydrogenase, group A [Oscillospiraceae bacterium]|nr:[FeFe] hydrogenase, group A [Oscillospiraceae bacterium]